MADAAATRVDAALSRAFLLSLSPPPGAAPGATHLAALAQARPSRSAAAARS